MKLDILSNKQSLFSFPEFKSWKRDNIVFMGAEYSVNLHDRIIRMPSSGSCELLESMTHEIGHVVHLIINKRFDRLMKENYGMSFTKYVKDIDKAVKNESIVFLIQEKIFRRLGATSNQINKFLEFNFNSMYNLDSITHDSAASKKAIEKYRKLSKNRKWKRQISFKQIEDAWNEYLKFIDLKMFEYLVDNKL